MRQHSRKQPLTVKIAMWSAHRPWLVVGLWFACVLGLFGSGLALGTKTNDVTGNTSASRLESSQAGEAFNKGGGVASSDQLIVVVSHPTLKTTDAAFRETVVKVSERLRGITYNENGQPQKAFANVLDNYSAGLLGASLTAQDGSTVRVIAAISGESEVRKKKLEPAKPVLKALQEENRNFKLLVFNGTLLNNDFNKVLTEELDGSLRITLPLTFIILLIAFGAVVAAIVPLVLAVTALLAAFGILALYSQWVSPVENTASQVVILIGLAVGIDYSLFIITRYRTERRHGRERLAALEVASSTAGRAVFFSGLTVMISLAGLYLVGDPIFSSIATGTIGVVLVAVIGSLTFLPAILSILGNGINWGRLPYFGREREEGSGFWAKLVATVMRRPIISTLVVLVFLLVATAPLLHIRLGNNALDGLPDSLEGVQAIRLMNEKWPQGTTLKMQVVITGADKPETKAAIEKFKEAALQVKGLSGPVESLPSRTGQAVRLEFVMSGNRNDPANHAIVRQVRQELVPASFGGLADTRAYVAGGAASTLDQVKFYTEALPVVFGFVLGLSFLLLLVAFHSIVIPIKAILLNLLSSGAAYGAMVAVFQDGWFSQQLGFRPTGVIENFAPLFMFTILFGLSMDYHLFILTRIKESKDRGMSSNEAVAKGISVTSGTITSAAAIMVVVFAVFVTLQIMIVRQLGLGLAVAVFVDATIIRCILLPATMRLLGEWNWWIPKFLDWLPQVTIEGESDDYEPAKPEPETELVKTR